MQTLLDKQPKQRVFNVGNPESVSVLEWVDLCYKTLGKTPEFRFVEPNIGQRSYFPFYDYEYFLNVEKMLELMPEIKPIEVGLKQSCAWFKENRAKVRRKPFFEFIDKDLRG